MALRKSVAPQVVLAIGLPFAAALFVFLTNGMVPFSNDGHCDPWHYFGYFYLDDQFAAVGDSRTYSRLPTTILGFMLTKLFRSVFADYSQYVLLLVLTVAPVFLVSARLYGTFAACIAALFLSTSGVVIGVLSVTYTGPALAWSTLAMTAALASSFAGSERRRSMLLVAAGFFWGSAIVGHLYSLTYNFVVPIYAISWTSVQRRNVLAQFKSIAAYCLLGCILSVLVFGLISKFVLHAEFTFFRHQFLEIFNIKVTEYQRPGWYMRGGKLALVILGIALAGAGLGLRRLFPDLTRSLAVNAPLAALMVAQVAYTAIGGITLQYDYYYVWFLPPVALSLAAAISLLEPVGRERVVYGLLFGAASRAATLFGYSTVVDVVPAWPSLAVGGIFGIAVVALGLRQSRATLPTALLGLALLSTTVRPERMGTQVWSMTGDGAGMYQRVRDGWDFLAQLHVQERPIFWLSTKDGLSETIAYPRGFEYCHVDTALPKFLSPDDEDYDARAEGFAAGRLIVIALPDDVPLASAVAALQRERSLGLNEMASRRIARNGTSYTLVAGRLVAAGAGK
jgi:hypothetical protein